MRFLIDKRLCVLLLLLLPLIVLADENNEKVYWQMGDNPLWSEQNFDHHQWTIDHLNDLPRADPIIWFRKPISLSEQSQGSENSLSLVFVGMAAYEVYWDGHLLGRNGMVGSDPTTEQPGQLMQEFYIPESLRVGPHHIIAMRLSTHHTGFSPVTGYYAVNVGSYTGITRSISWQLLLPVLTMGVFLFSALFFFILYLSTPERRSYLLLSLFSLSTAAMLMAEAWRPLFGYSYDWHIIRLRSILGLAMGSGVLINLFLLSQFQLKLRWRWYLLLLAAALLLAYLLPGYDRKTMVMHYVFYLLGLLLAAWAYWQKRQGSRFALTGIGVAILIMLLDPYGYLDRGVFLASSIILAALIISTVLFFKHQEIQHRKSLQEAEKLRQQLIQRHLQPHFLMNTLTALQEWMESDPKAGSQLIDHLADLYRDLNSTSEQDLIPLKEEVALCDKYLRVMGFRQNHQYQLLTEGIRSHDQLPPGIVLTWLENAITHNQYSHSPTRFKLSVSRSSGEIKYTLAVPLSHRKIRSGSGMGTRYILARMDQVFEGRFKMDAGVSDGQWMSSLRISL